MNMQIQKRTIRWTQEEIDFIKENFENMPDEEMAKKLNRTTSGVKDQRLKLGLKRERKRSSNLVKRNRTKITWDEIQEMFNNRGYVLLSDSSEYKNQSSKMRYICPKHKDKGELSISVYHLKEGKECPYCGRERTGMAHKSKITENEDRELCSIKGFEYIKTEIENGIPFIYFVCKKHKMLGVQKMRRGNMNRESVNGCQYCSNKNLPHWYVKYIIESTFPIEVLSEYKGMNKSLTCRCTIHDEIFTNLAKYIFHDGAGCKKCYRDKMTNRFLLPLDEVEKRVLEKNPDVEILNLHEYKGYESQIIRRCKKCGHVWGSPFHSICVNSGYCPNCQCSCSHGEYVITNVLIEKNISYISQYKFDDCRYKNPLPFDFAIIDNKENVLGLVEYQGEQHYKAIEFFGGQESFLERQRNDNIKRDYAKANQIPLLEIPYWEFNNIKEHLDTFINSIK